MDEDFKHGRRLQYDPRWKGPLKGRSCTDWFCLIIFLAFIGGWGAVGWFAYTHGDANKLLTPIDSEGRFCGHDPDVRNKPYLLFFDLTKCINVSSTIFGCDTPQVCVKECPKTNYFWQSYDKSTDLNTLRSTTICKNGITLKNMSFKQIETLIEHNMCARWYLKSIEIIGRCYPIGIPDSFLKINFPITQENLEIGKNYTELLMRIQETVKHSWDDFRACSWVVLAILGCGAVVSLFYILLIRWFATPIIWLSIVGVCGLLAYGTYFFFTMYTKNSTTSWLVLTIACGVLLCIVLLVTIFLRNRIRLACQLIGEASKAVLSTTSTLAFPIVPWILKLVVLAYALTVAAYVFTMRGQNYTVQIGSNCQCPTDMNYMNGTVCSPKLFNSKCTISGSSIACGGCYIDNTRGPWFLKYVHAYNLVGFVWLTFFISAFGEMVLAGTFATWYWTLKKSDVPYFTLTTSIWRTLRYHIGTLAFGSLIITICRLIRCVLEYLDAKLKQYDNELVNFLMKCMRCYFWLLERFLKFINKNAYIMCAIHGKNFCGSARSAFNLLMRNIIRVFVLDKITDWLLFMGRLLVTGSVGWGSWWYITNRHPEITYWQAPVIVIVIGTYSIASLFFGVYSMAVDTLFLCFLEDSERNDGSTEKPYYMSKGLRHILNK